MKVHAIHFDHHYTHHNAVGQPVQGGHARPGRRAVRARAMQGNGHGDGTGWAANRIIATR